MIYMDGLDEEQIAAVRSSFNNTLVVAAPGSGKTTVIVNRVNYLVNELKELEDKIAVITFTKAAALNMRTRYIKLKGSETKAFFGTFHALYYRILKEYYSNYNIISEGVSIDIIRSILNTYTNTVHNQTILKILSEIYSYKTKDSLEFKPSVDKSIFIECYNYYEKYKKDNFLWDFEDLQIGCFNLLSNNSTVLKKCQKKFNHILVDEFQDSDEIQIRILKMLNLENSIFAVGDEDQSIYSFRGAAPRYMVDFCYIFKNSKKVYLNTNYRCPESIVEKSINLITNNSMRNIKPIKPYCKIQCTIELLSFDNEIFQGNTIVDKIIHRYSANCDALEDNIILYRTRSESRSIVDALIEKGIRFTFLDEPFNFYEHFICKDIISILKLCCNSTLRKEFIYSMHLMGLSMGHPLKNKLLSYRYSISCFHIMKELTDSPTRLKELIKFEKRFSKLRKIKQSRIIDYICCSLGYKGFVEKNYISLGTTKNSIQHILESLKYELCKFSNIEDFLTHVEAATESIMKSGLKLEGVRLSTIHGVKGMEFKNVFIVNCNDGLIPHAKNIKNLEEERRLFYVGITRSKCSLTLCSSSKLRGKSYEVSRFISELKL